MSFKSNVPDIREQFIKHPLLQSKVRVSPSEAAGAAELAFLRGDQHGHERLEAYGRRLEWKLKAANAEIERLKAALEPAAVVNQELTTEEAE